ncbi:MAG TPA: glycosyltransferase [Polyangia bacterium]|nr:glycosyltransferase [Polyangia bacterium]
MAAPAVSPHDSQAFPAHARQRITLCMIVRNEAARLERCLTSAMPWVGDAVVVDTGSTDGTAALAEALGARVVHFAWCDDFSQARNQAVENARTPWALVLDADEQLVVDDADAWARAMTQEKTAAFSVDCHDQLDDGGVAVGPILRLFRRDLPGMRYAGEIHEQITAVAERRYVTAHARFLHIDHDGHTGAVMREHKTVERNLTLARAMVASRSGDPFAWFCLGQALEAAQTPALRTVEVYEKALTLFLKNGPAERDESYLAALWINLTRVVMRTGDRRKANQLSARAVAEFPTAPDLRFLRGRVLAEDGQHGAASAEFEACLTPAAQTFFIRQDPGATSYAAQTQLGLCRLRLGELPAAEEWLRRAMADAPTHYLLPRLALGMVLLMRAAPAEAEPILHAAVESHPDNADARLQWARALLAQCRRADAERALAPLGTDPRATQLLATV